MATKHGSPVRRATERSGPAQPRCINTASAQQQPRFVMAGVRGEILYSRTGRYIKCANRQGVGIIEDPVRMAVKLKVGTTGVSAYRVRSGFSHMFSSFPRQIMAFESTETVIYDLPVIGVPHSMGSRAGPSAERGEGGPCTCNAAASVTRSGRD